jgi:glycine hydroxymethyltransferase
MKPSYQKYAEKVAENAKVLSEELVDRGFTLVTGGTDNHLMVVDLRPNEIEGSVAEKNLEKNGIIANRNTVPGDLSAFKPSGIRIGTPAVTTRGMGKKEMKKIAELIERAVLKDEDVSKEVLVLTKRFPLKYSNK